MLLRLSFMSRAGSGNDSRNTSTFGMDTVAIAFSSTDADWAELFNHRQETPQAWTPAVVDRFRSLLRRPRSTPTKPSASPRLASNCTGKARRTESRRERGGPPERYGRRPEGSRWPTECCHEDQPERWRASKH